MALMPKYKTIARTMVSSMSMAKRFHSFVSRGIGSVFGSISCCAVSKLLSSLYENYTAFCNMTVHSYTGLTKMQCCVLRMFTG
jgi:hypothetical protein